MEIAQLESDWNKVTDFMQERFGKESDIKSVLFVIGLRELGQRKNKFTKEDKQDLMNLAFCTILSRDGYFRVSHLDGEGWPVWKQAKPMPVMNVTEQENFIRKYIVLYFQEEHIIS